MIRFTLALPCCLLSGQGQPLVPPQATSRAEQRIAWNKAHYTKIEAMVPMRDGKAIYTVIYTPKDQSKAYPIILTRSPYGTSGRFFGTDVPSMIVLPMLSSSK